jgi:hypothetical protein
LTDTTAGCSSSPEKPCLVPAGQGFSLTYKNRTLYSKYAPEKAMLQCVSQLSLRPGTLILAVSPCLWYGLPELAAKLPENCFILGIEYDQNLYETAADELKKNTCLHHCLEKVLLIRPEELDSLPLLLSHSAPVTADGRKLPPPGSLRRVTSLDFSGGTFFYKDRYAVLCNAVAQTISQFWKNRLTLIKLGRLYSRNIFKNLAQLPSSTPITRYTGTIDKPVIVIGAGESAEATLKELLKTAQTPQEVRSRYYILCVDAALPLVESYGIIPSGIVGVESQLAIEKAYIGQDLAQSTLFADITSRVHINRLKKDDLCFFSSAFTDASFFSEPPLSLLLPLHVPALGSVGLTAVYLASILRAGPQLPVSVTGLDFSYTPGITHARGTPAATARLLQAARISPPHDYQPVYKTGAKIVSDKSDTLLVCTDAALSGYAETFRAFFSTIPELFDIGNTGLDLGIPRRTLAAETAGWQTERQQTHRTSTIAAKASLPAAAEVAAYLTGEEEALIRIKKLLTGDHKKTEPAEITAELSRLLSNREYLFLHFPDGYKCSTENISFLKRIRAELDFFLKDIRSGKIILKIQ